MPVARKLWQPALVRMGVSLILLRIIPWIIEVPAVVMIGLWAALQFLNAFSGQTDGVAYLAHVGGFVAGLVLAFVLRGASGPGPRMSYQQS